MRSDSRTGRPPGADGRALNESRRSAGAVDAALNQVTNRIRDGLRHGYFEFTLTCEVIGSERRRLVLRAGKTYQFVLPGDACIGDRPTPIDSRHGSDATEIEMDATDRRHGDRAAGSGLTRHGPRAANDA